MDPAMAAAGASNTTAAVATAVVRRAPLGWAGKEGILHHAGESISFKASRTTTNGQCGTCIKGIEIDLNIAWAVITLAESSDALQHGFRRSIAVGIFGATCCFFDFFS